MSFLLSRLTRPSGTRLLTRTSRTIEPLSTFEIIAKPPISLRPILQTELHILHRDILARRRCTTLETSNWIPLYHPSHIAECDILNLEQRRVAIASNATECYALGDTDGE